MALKIRMATARHKEGKSSVVAQLQLQLEKKDSLLEMLALMLKLGSSLEGSLGEHQGE